MEFQKLKNTCSVAHLYNVSKLDLETITRTKLRTELYFEESLNTSEKSRIRNIILFSNHYLSLIDRISKKIKLIDTLESYYENKKLYVYRIKI